MHILFTRFPLESAHGGAEIQTSSLMNGLQKRDHTVTFAGSCPVMLELSEQYGIKNQRLNIGTPPVTKWKAMSFVWRAKQMQGKLMELLDSYEKLDAIVMMSLSEKLLLTPLALKKNIKVYWLEHDLVGRWLKRNPWLMDLRKLSKKVTTICVSELSRKIYLDLGWKPKTIVAIPNGIDPNRFANSLIPNSQFLNKELGDRNLELGKAHNLKIGCIARLTHDKGVDVLLRALKETSDAQLEIIGGGREKETILNLMNELQVSDRTYLKETSDDLGAFYQSIDVLVLPSRQHDPFGLVAAEAMLLGTPVIVTDACGIADYLEDGKDALVVRADSSDALATALEMLKKSEFRNDIATAGKEAAEKKFLLNTMIDTYEELLANSYTTDRA